MRSLQASLASGGTLVECAVVLRNISGVLFLIVFSLCIVDVCMYQVFCFKIRDSFFITEKRTCSKEKDGLDLFNFILVLITTYKSVF